MNNSSKSKVAVVYCDSYDNEQVYMAMCAGIDMLGGIEHFVGKEERILVKPNFLVPSEPDKAIITHPSVITAMLRILHEHDYVDICCGDSPGHGTLSSAFTKAGLEDVLRQYGVRQADMSDEVLTDFPEGIEAKRFWLTKAAAESDAIISLSKMKTHALEKITGAVKNLYGLICGYRKAAGHVKYPNASIFARMLADIHRCVKPRLHIMDGIAAMEGNGPGSGTPVKMNVLLFSADPVALDAVFCRLVDLAPEFIPTNVQGQELGIGTYQFENIEIVTADCSASVCLAAAGARNDADVHLEVCGSEAAQTAAADAECGNGALQAVNAAAEADHRIMMISADELYEKYGDPGFDVDRKGSKKTFLSRFSDVMTSMARRPYIDEKLCIKCGICTEHCPVPGKAVAFRGDKSKAPAYDYKKCIRCYCCQEMCPQHAIKVRRL